MRAMRTGKPAGVDAVPEQVELSSAFFVVCLVVTHEPLRGARSRPNMSRSVSQKGLSKTSTILFKRPNPILRIESLFH